MENETRDLSVLDEYKNFSFVLSDANKVPLGRWKKYTEQKPSDIEIAAWHKKLEKDPSLGVSIICGKVSGNLLTVDFDLKPVDGIADSQKQEPPFALEDFISAVMGVSLEQLKNSTWVSQTPHGLHLHYFVSGADLPNKNYTLILFGNYKYEIDIKGQNGLAREAPSPGYANLSKPSSTKTIAKADFDNLLAKLKLLEEVRPYIELLLPVWQPGKRQLLALAFAAFMRKKLKLSVEEAKSVIFFLGKLRGDEEIDLRLAGVDDTYEKNESEVAVLEWAKAAGAEEIFQQMYSLLSGGQPETQVSPELDNLVQKFAADPHKFEIVSYLISLAHIGDQRTAMAMFFQILQARSKTPVNIVVKGPASSGKTDLTNTVLDLFPASWVQRIGRLTSNAIYYLPESNAPILYLQELKVEGNESYGLKLSSADDGGFSIGYVVRDPASGEMTTKIKKVGARCFVATTTSIEIDPELETRTTEYNIGENQEVTRQVLRFKAASEEMPISFKELFKTSQLRRIIQAYIDSLPSNMEVKIPYASAIAEQLPTFDVRIRRDIDKLFALIKGIAAFDWQNRLHVEKDGKIIVISAVHDYALAFDLFADAFKQTITGLDARAFKILEVMKTLEPENRTAPKISGRIPEIKSTNTTRALLKHMMDLGYVEIDEDLSKPNKVVYALGTVAGSNLNMVEHALNMEKMPDLSSKISQILGPMFKDSTEEYVQKYESILQDQQVICSSQNLNTILHCISEYDSVLSSVNPMFNGVCTWLNMLNMTSSSDASAISLPASTKPQAGPEASGDPAQPEARASARARRQALVQAIYKAIERSNELNVPVWIQNDLGQDINPDFFDIFSGFNTDEVKDVWQKMHQAGLIFEPKPGKWEIVRQDDDV